ncbi:MAG: glycosyltransferase, partial [Ignisphaera sp.]
MQKKNILLISTKGLTGLSADKIRIRYFRQVLEISGYNFVIFEINLSGFRKYLLYFLRSPPKELEERAKDADLIMTTSPSLISAILGYRIAEKLGKPLIADVRDIWEEYAKAAHSLAYRIGVIPRIIKDYYKALSYSSKIITATEFMKQYYERKLGIRGEKIILISNGTDVDLIMPSEEIKREIDAVCLADLNQPYHNLEFLFNALKLE